MVSQTIAWYKERREVLEGDVIHLRRADGSDLDYWLNVNPSGDEKGMLLVYNPLDRTVNKTIRVPLYFTGIKDKATVQVENQKPMVYDLDREYNIQLEITVEKNHYTWVTIK